ncbi:MAG: rod shape-determining protein RodA [Candidatus Scatovivens sp.]
MRNKLLRNTEWSIIVVSIILLLIGIVALFSATQSTEYNEFKKQIQWFIISIPFIILAFTIDYNVIVKFSPLLYFILIGLLVGVLFTEPINGASSWYKIGDFLSFQPSELGKIIIILFMALILSKLQLRGKREINKIWKLFIYLFLFAVPILLIVKQPDYGTAMAYIFACLFMLFVSGIDKKYIIVSILLIAIALPLLYIYVLPEHAKTRIEVFLNPNSDPRGAGYNIIQSKLAIGAGELFGMGLFKGNQTQLGFLSPKTTDFIFSVIGEEMGFVGACSIVILYIVLVTKSIYVAKTAKDNVGSYIAIGITGIFFFHMLENIGMTIGILPITGIPLPFVSYGGSALITNFICIGLLLNVSSRRQKAIFVE